MVRAVFRPLFDVYPQTIQEMHEEFDSHEFIGAIISREIDDTHATLGQLPDDLAVTDSG